GRDHAFKDLAIKDPAFKDHFSSVADAYAAARPEYPDGLFDAIAALVPGIARVWEPGCGSGQATRALAARFAHVHATDPSAQQMAQHWASMPLDDRGPGRDPTGFSQRRVETPPVHIALAVEPAEHTSLSDASVQLIAVAQALHWFDRPAFFAECERVLAPGGVLAAWGYPDFIAPEGMIEAVADFRAQIEPHWPPERVQVDAHYAGYDWPFPAVPGYSPSMSWLEAEWTLPRFLRYLASSSATARCIGETGDDPVARHAPALAAAWGDAGDVRTLQWPLFLHLRRKPER
ncbi:MAG: class I SAM-dependent methyltransferase, partial [Pseudomonadota bacterium]|nr:class I SAM-dependent methyltransferase [Pseudomonadota bacterium]